MGINSKSCITSILTIQSFTNSALWGFTSFTGKKAISTNTSMQSVIGLMLSWQEDYAVTNQRQTYRTRARPLASRGLRQARKSTNLSPSQPPCHPMNTKTASLFRHPASHWLALGRSIPWPIPWPLTPENMTPINTDSVSTVDAYYMGSLGLG